MQTPYNVIAYKGKPRLGTALELLRTTQAIERQLEEVWELSFSFSDVFYFSLLVIGDITIWIFWIFSPVNLMISGQSFPYSNQ